MRGKRRDQLRKREKKKHQRNGENGQRKKKKWGLEKKVRRGEPGRKGRNPPDVTRTFASRNKKKKKRPPKKKKQQKKKEKETIRRVKVNNERSGKGV